MRDRRVLLAIAGLLWLAGSSIAQADHPGKVELDALKSAVGSPEDPVDVPPAPAVRRAEPPLLPTPQAKCGRRSRPETGIQGRVPRSDHQSGRAAKGYTCNTKLVGSFEKPTVFGTVGGFKVERYVDDAGHECAYYDTTLLYPTNIFDLEGGVNVMDMSDPSMPVRTARLTTPAMLSPHESLVVSKKRGVLAAVMGNAAFNLGVVDLYDISKDCRFPVHKATTPIGIFGHESGMAPDGRTFYTASPGTNTVVAIDITNLTLPRVLWIGNYPSHGLSISSSGRRAYIAGVGAGMITLDTSAIQARKPNPYVYEISRLKWDSMSIPQNAIPVRINDRKYAIEIDEFGAQSEVGAGRIISIENEERPRVVSNLRLAVHQPENFAAQANDPGAEIPVQGYAGHYCNVPKRKDPGIVACSMILSGLRVFDIRDPRNPREIAYYNAPIKPRVFPPAASNWAMSSPAFDRKSGEIWYSDGFQGFFAVRVTNGMWPFPRCNGRESTITATGLRTRGTAGADVIVGRKGRRDRIRGRGGDDLVCTRGGADVVAGARGADRLYGGADRDRLRGGKGRDRLGGGSGDDKLVGGRGRDKLVGGKGRDRKRQ